mmetsp:Transcript_18987/g.45852  ORF Transcript_18987/g.45852 Transcript_18987/m.45852 type:complete len:673 (-) Transcript_18987:48-2066(-)
MTPAPLEGKGGSHNTSRSRDESDSDTITTAASTEKQRHSPLKGSRKEWIVRQLYSMVMGSTVDGGSSSGLGCDSNDNEDENDDNEQQKKVATNNNNNKRKVLAGLLSLAVAYSVFKFWRRRGRRGRKLSMLSLYHSIPSTLMSIIQYLRPRLSPYANAESVSLGRLRSAATSRQIETALLSPSKIVFMTNDGTWLQTRLPDPTSSSGGNSTTTKWTEKLIDLIAEGCNDISSLPEPLSSQIVSPLLASLPFLYLFFVGRMLKNIMNKDNLDGSGGNFLSTKIFKSDTTSSNPTKTTTFADVAGLDFILPEVQEIVAYLRHPTGYHALGAEPPRGVLLHGLPGAGKTLLARAIAGEADCDAFMVCSGSDFCEMYVGRGAARVRSLFQEARRLARTKYARKCGLAYGWKRLLGMHETNSSESLLRPPTAIIFIDELDALAKTRSYGGSINGNDERDQTLNQLLIEMDGFFCQTTLSPISSDATTSNSITTTTTAPVTIMVVAATNRAETLDPAVLRRFDRQLFIPLPDKKGREAILQVHASKTSCRSSTIRWDHLAEMTSGFSGSDLKQVVNDAALLAVRQKNNYIEQGHLLQSIHRAKAMKVQRGRSFGRSGGGGGVEMSSSSLFTPSSSSAFGMGTTNQGGGGGGTYGMRDTQSPLMWFKPEIDSGSNGSYS